MTGEERNRQMDAARVRAELTVQDLWLRYIGLGGTCDAFDVDGYLQGLMSLETCQQDVLAQTLNEALEDLYRAHRIPLATPTAVDDRDDDRVDDRLRGLIEQLLQDPSPARHHDHEPRGDDTS